MPPRKKKGRRRSPSPPDAGPRVTSAAATPSAAAPSNTTAAAVDVPSQWKGKKPKISAASTAAASTAAAALPPLPPAAVGALTIMPPRGLPPDDEEYVKTMITRALLGASRVGRTQVALDLIASAIRAESYNSQFNGKLVLRRDWAFYWHSRVPTVVTYKHEVGKDAAGRPIMDEKTVKFSYDPETQLPYNTYAVLDWMFSKAEVTMDRLLAMFGFYYPGFPVSPTRPEDKVSWPLFHTRAMVPGRISAYQIICKPDFAMNPNFLHGYDGDCTWLDNPSTATCCEEYNFFVRRSLHQSFTIGDLNNLLIALAGQKTAPRLVRGEKGAFVKIAEPKPALWGYANDPRLLRKILYGKWVQALRNGLLAKVSIVHMLGACRETQGDNKHTHGVLTEMYRFLLNHVPNGLVNCQTFQVFVPIEVDSENKPIGFICVRYAGDELSHSFLVHNKVADFYGEIRFVARDRRYDHGFRIGSEKLSICDNSLELGLNPVAFSNSFEPAYPELSSHYTRRVARVQHMMYDGMFADRRKVAKKEGESSETTSAVVVATTAAAASSSSSSSMQ